MIDMKHNRLVLARSLPKTGQTLVYRTGDDGSFQAGWWKARTIVNNKTRFVAKTIGSDDVVIDLATGLMWAANGNAAGCNNGDTGNWNVAIDYPLALDFAGFTDWRLPNINELISIINYSVSNPSINGTFFPNTGSDKYWTSTNYLPTGQNRFYVRFDYGFTYNSAPTELYLIRSVRGGV